ncbi:MAG: hypothetical protein QNJ54_38060 [Prochloraceae cyanobacterium]|nr:hypothetical protein [Prochloraceae cyanobacterium]
MSKRPMPHVLDVGDLFYLGQPVELQANLLTANELDTDFTVTLWRSGTTQPVVSRLMTRIENHWQKTVFESLAPGDYRVEVSGEDVETAGDAFVVADIKEGQEEG